MKIALWGAPGTGKAALADQLRQVLEQLPTSSASVLIEVMDGDTASKPPGPADLGFVMGLERVDSQALAREQQLADQHIRSLLASAGMAYEVLYGPSADRLAQALDAIGRLLKSRSATLGGGRPTRPARPWVWNCEKCSDAACEHRLLSDLLARRPASPDPFIEP